MKVIWRLCAAAMLAVCAVCAGLAGAIQQANAAYAAIAYEPTSAAPSASSEQQAAQIFLRAAERLYEAANSGDGAEMMKQLANVELRLRKLPMTKIASADGIEALAQRITRMKRLAAAVSPDPQSQRELAAQIRLAADAIVYPQSPMWHDYQAILRDDIRNLEQAMAQHGMTTAALSQLRLLQSHYARIRTAVLMHAQPYTIERADSVLRYAERVLAAVKPNADHLAGLIPALQASMSELFPPGSWDDASQATLIPPVQGPPWGWSAFMGMLIVAVLTWVGWYRYGELYPINPRGTLPPAHHGRRQSR